MGKEISPIEMTEAATTPVVAADGVEQILSHARAFKNQPHQGEERDRQQRLVLHDAENTQRQRLHQRSGQHAQFDTDEAEEQAAGTEAEGDRKAHQQKNDQPHEHDGGEVGGEEFHGVSGPQPLLASGAARMASASSSSAVLMATFSVGSGI